MVTLTPEAILTQKIAQLRGRVRLLVAQRWMFRTLLVATGACGVAALALRLAGAPLPLEWLPVALALAAAGGALYGWTRPVTPMDAARLADDRLALRERLSSGIDFVQRHPPPRSGSAVDPVRDKAEAPRDPLVAAQIEDAARHSARLMPAEVFPYRLPREGRLLAVTAAVLIAVLFVPELSIFQSPQQRAEKAALKREGAKLQQLAREALRRKTPTNMEITRRVAENMRHLGVEMQRGRVNKKQAMLALGKMSKELRDEQRRMALGESPKSLERAAAEMKRAAADPRLSGQPSAGRAMAEVARALEQRDFEAAAKALGSLAEKLKNGQMSEAEAKAAAAALSQMAASLKNSDLDAVSKQLREAARQLQAAQKLASGKNGAQARQALRQAMQQAGTACAKAGGT
jgi:hypothetical protein